MARAVRVRVKASDVLDLPSLLMAAGLPEPETEWRFHPVRRFRFDACWPQYLVAVEKQGGTWTHGRHSRGAGQRADAEKLAEAQLLGWLVIFATVDMLRDGLALTLVERALRERGWQPKDNA